MGRPKTDAATYKNLQLRIPDDLLAFLHELAAEERRSLNAQILRLIEDRRNSPGRKRDYAYSHATDH